ncbi:elongation factor P 5-aminopentanone reductase [Cohnella sp. JJ-181]|uniref:elongation factor P 5-aminopentanone reductase n=1 Tax=Cohnella rhizoplanae TaxID=2974897 RepID=UPI0022FF6DA9|nr:SDR family NAD(P)-dependent oxidoreductase [Cohnella sp. JJ-181]CAI6028628.1 3-oxoacyl-[acyl-carrier-protein] reductase FabG [Cohnella sp. JJ-181]
MTATPADRTAQTPVCALVTGASRGIGAAVARRLSRDGAGVIVHYYRSREQAEAVAADCLALGAAFAEPAAADVRSAAQIAALKARLELSGRMPDILVHAAGTAHYGLLEDLGESEWDDIQHVHLKAAYGLAKSFGPSMSWRRGGRIVHISSVWGVVGAAGEVAYSAAKGGVNGLTKALARELATAGVTVNAVAPGMVETDMLAELDEAERAALREEVPMRRFATPEEVAELVRFLTLGASDYITGQIIGLTGGWRM